MNIETVDIFKAMVTVLSGATAGQTLLVNITFEGSRGYKRTADMIPGNNPFKPLKTSTQRVKRCQH